MTCTDGTVQEPAHDAGGGRAQARREVNEPPGREPVHDGRRSV